MRKLKRTFAIFVCFITLFMSLGINSFAVATAPAEISVIINEQAVDFKNVKPVMLNDRVFVPLRAFFEALGAKVSFDDATQTITSTRDETTVKLTIGSKTMITTNKSGSSSSVMDVAPFIDGDYTMIPARYAASAFGCSIGWDNSTQTVLILDADTLIKSGGAHYTLMDKYLNIGRFKKLSRTYEGSLYMSMSGVTEDPAKISGTFSGIESKDAVNMNMSLDMSDYIGQLASASLTSAYDNSLLGKFKKIDIKMIQDLKEKKFYYQSPQVTEPYKIESDAWILSANSKSSSLSSLAPSDADSPNIFNNVYTNFEEYIRAWLKAKRFSTKASLQTVIDDFKLTNSYFSDERFTNDGGLYSNIQKSEKNGTVTEFRFQITVQNNEAVAYSMQKKISSAYYTVDSLYSMDINKNVIAKTSTYGYSMKIDMNFNIKITDTDELPLSKPSSGKIYDEKSLKIA